MFGFLILGTAAFGTVTTFGTEPKVIGEKVRNFFTLETRMGDGLYQLPSKGVIIR